ncbi:hypothetical protein N2152v2_006777 [Parachlorella kessleri]
MTSALPAGAIATGAYIPGQHTPSGWAQLKVTTLGDFPDEDQMRAAGYLEGYLSAEQIHAHRHNVGAHFNITSESPAVQWLVEQHDWVSQQAAANHTAFWRAMRLLLAQLDGLVAGYAKRAEQAQLEGGSVAGRVPRLGLSDFLFMSAVGDFDDVLSATARGQEVAWSELTPSQLSMKLATSGKCSALVRVTGDFSDLMLAHSAWYTYGGLVRVYKHIDFALRDPDVRLSGMSFSSYPGELSSDDDFYLLDTGLVVLQTTNSVFNTKLYDTLTPKSVLSWQRARVASFLASSGQEWVGHMQEHNSGTGNNQWMVVDLKRFSPGRELEPGLLWVVEQAPGLVVSSDATETLVRGYWPSYNIPFHPAVYNHSGYPQFIQQQAARGLEYANAVSGVSYQLAPRAKIFRRDVGGVTDLPSLKDFMRSNDWPDDPYSGGSPTGAICARGDLDPRNPRPYGCIDTKATHYRMALQRQAYAVNGPTTAGGRLPPFEWKGEAAERVAHIGQPARFDYDFELMTPTDELWGGGTASAAVS